MKLLFFLPQTFEFHCVCHFWISSRPHICYSSAHTTGEKIPGCRFGELAAWWGGQRMQPSERGIWVMNLGALRGAGFEDTAHTLADVPQCHSASPAEWITRQMFNVKAGLSCQENTFKHMPDSGGHIHTHTHTHTINNQ